LLLNQEGVAEQICRLRHANALFVFSWSCAASEHVDVKQGRNWHRGPFFSGSFHGFGLARLAEDPIGPIALDKTPAVVVADTGVGFIDENRSDGRWGPDLSSAPWSPAEDRSLPCAMKLATSQSVTDLCSFVLGDHPLDLD
jgi:hypothetical protein